MCSQDGFKMASMELDLGFDGFWCGWMQRLIRWWSKWHYDVALNDCDILAWEGIPFIG